MNKFKSLNIDIYFDPKWIVYLQRTLTENMDDKMYQILSPKDKQQYQESLSAYMYK